MASVTRTHPPLRPHACVDKKTGTGIDLQGILEKVHADAELCATEAFKHITPENMEKSLNMMDGSHVMPGKLWELNYSPKGELQAVPLSSKWCRTML